VLAAQFFIYPGTDLSKIDWSVGRAGDELLESRCFTFPTFRVGGRDVVVVAVIEIYLIGLRIYQERLTFISSFLTNQLRFLGPQIHLGSKVTL
jgi:hypothetical protein